MPKFLHNVFKKKFWALINIIFFIYFLFFIEKKIKSLGIRKIKVFKYSNWDDGFMHFKGIVDHKPKRKVFIKIDLILKNIRNEYLALKNISKIKNKPFKTPKIYHSTNSYIITEFIPQCLPVKFNDIEVKNRRKLISFLVKKKIKHNDLDNKNILISGNDLYIIDWYLATKNNNFFSDFSCENFFKKILFSKIKKHIKNYLFE